VTVTVVDSARPAGQYIIETAVGRQPDGPRTGHPPWRKATTCVIGVECSEGGVMAKRFGRPSLQYRYEHYDPELLETRSSIAAD
jgi:hypothetical protein